MALVDEDSAGVRFPPPLIVLGALLLGVGIDRLVGLPQIEWAVLRPVGIATGVIGFALSGWGVLGFLRAGNDPEPWKRDTALVTSGLYRFTRNPMYLGFVMVQLGVALYYQSIGGLLSVPLSIILLQHFVIAREEAHLVATFQDEYRAYMRRVRRWI